ncbi:uncharacterized protein LOC126910235 isoform X2 [Daktulosphaira vitifoliae]|uniref:uncharacterized protein LOC126910235 isoform X2 n=1 Tax=Daktulosphaira vitifoliae TaxID=58002 RepID=UPI0021AADB59|nr:uncharacterized protein LOC126910235 isoform X2 [Daktulosphaira vitifoliae]
MAHFNILLLLQNSYLIKFMTLYFILSNELSSSIITLDKNKEELNKIDEALDKNKEALDKSNEEESDSYDCPICLQELGEDFTEHECGNKYHIECLHRWEVESKYHNCPVCREILYPRCVFCGNRVLSGYRYHFHTKCCKGRLCEDDYSSQRENCSVLICCNCDSRGYIPVYKKPIIVPCVNCNENKPNHNVSSKCLHYYCKECTEEKVTTNSLCKLCSKPLKVNIFKKWYHKLASFH